MIRTDEFAKDMCNELELRWPELDWHSPRKPGKGHEQVDLAGSLKGKTLIYIEAELRRYAPAINVIKIWRWLDNKKNATQLGKLTVVQAFSGFYPKGDSRRAAAEFIGFKMAKAHKVRYVPIQFSYKPRKYGKVGAGRRRLHARLLATKISRKLRRELL